MKKLIIILGAVMMISVADIFSQYTNYRIFPSSSSQIEPFIVRHPTNPQILFASAYTILSAFRSEGVYVSTNGGSSWRGTDTLYGAPIIGGHGGDPGPIIDKNGVFILTHQGGAVTGMYANYSTNQGVSWSVNYPIITGDQDKGSPGTDDAPASPFYGRTYLVWTRFSPPFPIVISYTSNSGTNWSGVIQVNTSYGANRSFGPAVTVGPTGTVYAAWSSSIPNSPFTEDCIGFASSTNGGVNWSVNECAIDCNGIRTTQLSPWTIRANSYPSIDVDKTGGPRNGRIYIAVTDKNIAPAGSDPDVVLHWSTNGGSTWSSGVRVNRDPMNNGRNQFFPSLRIDEQGGINIIYYDNRNSVDSVDVYLSRSNDGGNTWAEARITQSRFKPAPVSGAGGAGNMGDNIGLTSGNGKLYPVWMSNVSGIFQIWSAIIDYSVFGIKKYGTEIPEQFSLQQNYPNPFNPSTKIKFGVPKNSDIKIIVYDASGKEIKILVNEPLSAGYYELDFNGSSLASGLYFGRLIADKFSVTKKMVLVK
jgi:type IX secretion system substrate protein